MDTVHPRSLGGLLKRYRLTVGLTQEALAERAGISVRGVSNLERGVNSAPRHDTLERLISALGLTPAERAVLLGAVQEQGKPSAESPVPLSSREPAMVGREAIMAHVERHLMGDGPPFLLISGEPGIGKTRLLHEVSKQAHAHGFTVLTASTSRYRVNTAYSPLLETLSQYLHSEQPARAATALEGCSRLQSILSEPVRTANAPAKMDPVEPGQQPLFEAVARFLTNIATPVGVVLLLDDLQWCNTDTVYLLDTLLRAADPAALHGSTPPVPLRVVGTMYEGELGSADALSTLLADLARAHLVRHIALESLAPAEAEKLLETLLIDVDAVPAVVKAHALQRAGGLPFFLVSFAEALHQSTGATLPLAIPWDINQHVRQQLGHLSPLAYDLLTIMSLHEPPVARATLVDLAGQAEIAVYDALDEACRAHLLIEDGHASYTFTREVIREVVVSTLGAAQRATLHRRLALMLEREITTATEMRLLQRLAYHCDQAGHHARAAVYLEQAGDQSQQEGTLAVAKECYQQAVVRFDRLGHRRDAARVRYKLKALDLADELAEPPFEGRKAGTLLDQSVKAVNRSASWPSGNGFDHAVSPL